MVIRVVALATALAATPATAGAARRVQVRAILCDSPKHAVAYADEMSSGVLADVAKDRVGKAAGAEACKLYRGVAKIEDEHVELVDGHADQSSFRARPSRRLAGGAVVRAARGQEGRLAVTVIETVVLPKALIDGAKVLVFFAILMLVLVALFEIKTRRRKVR